mmetsp:Transcript_6311/g.9170  ORF Transcript_6311/g.9170 Transcript_6311/m.9170 type:complete len:231 (+) Transcript_6311:230-922(+)
MAHALGFPTFQQLHQFVFLLCCCGLDFARLRPLVFLCSVAAVLNSVSFIGPIMPWDFLTLSLDRLEHASRQSLAVCHQPCHLQCAATIVHALQCFVNSPVHTSGNNNGSSCPRNTFVSFQLSVCRNRTPLAWLLHIVRKDHTDKLSFWTASPKVWFASCLFDVVMWNTCPLCCLPQCLCRKDHSFNRDGHAQSYFGNIVRRTCLPCCVRSYTGLCVPVFMDSREELQLHA